MFIAHVPASYLATELMLGSTRYKPLPVSRSGLLGIGVLAGIIPDIDIVYFYLIDNRQHLHHTYWTHIPFYWVMIISAVTGIGYCSKRADIVFIAYVAGVNIFIHLFLDTVVGKIKWLYPFSEADIVFFHVPAQYGWWVLNFVMHWTFAFEVALVSLAGYLLWRERSIKSPA